MACSVRRNVAAGLDLGEVDRLTMRSAALGLACTCRSDFSPTTVGRLKPRCLTEVRPTGRGDLGGGCESRVVPRAGAASLGPPEGMGALRAVALGLACTCRSDFSPTTVGRLKPWCRTEVRPTGLGVIREEDAKAALCRVRARLQSVFQKALVLCGPSPSVWPAPVGRTLVRQRLAGSSRDVGLKSDLQGGGDPGAGMRRPLCAACGGRFIRASRRDVCFAGRRPWSGLHM